MSKPSTKTRGTMTVRTILSDTGLTGRPAGRCGAAAGAGTEPDQVPHRLVADPSVVAAR